MMGLLISASKHHNWHLAQHTPVIANPCC